MAVLDGASQRLTRRRIGGAKPPAVRRGRREMCDQLSITRAVFIGESTGSMLQLSLALERPYLVAASVLAGGTYYWPPEMRASLSSQSPDRLARSWFPDSKTFEEFCAMTSWQVPIELRARLGSGCCMAGLSPPFGRRCWTDRFRAIGRRTG
jgi:pimeloyl-ACP methyl ester carboxylesterase